MCHFLYHETEYLCNCVFWPDAKLNLHSVSECIAESIHVFLFPSQSTKLYGCLNNASSLCLQLSSSVTLICLHLQSNAVV